MLSFDDTKIAFSGKDNKALKRSYWLFKMVGSPSLVSFGKGLTNFALALHLPISGLIKATIFKQFVGGENIQECNKTVQELSKYKIGTILDYSVEGKQSDDDFNYGMDETIRTIHRAKGDKGIPFTVFKVTGIARFDLLEKVSAGTSLSNVEISEYSKVKERVQKICSTALEAGVPVFIDAEESWIQNAIDGLADGAMKDCNKERVIVYNTFQLYRTDRLEFLKTSFAKAEKENYLLGAKLVRGAYMEKERARAAEKGYPSPIQNSKEDTDRDYDLALSFCLQHIDKIALCAGTHNEKSSAYLVQLMSEKNIPSNHPHIVFSQLFGMSDHISYNLAAANYNVAKYVPYGPVKEVLPYLIRRAQENTSVKGQTGRELGLIMKEQERRKKGG